MNRFSKLLLLLVVFISSFSMVQAQRGGRNANPEASAERQTKIMTDSLGLSEAQTEKIAAVNLDYAKKMTEARKKMRENTDGDWETMRATMRTTMTTLQTEQQAELKKYLTTEQSTKWDTIVANRKSRQGDRRRGGGKGKKGKGKRKAKSDERTK